MSCAQASYTDSFIGNLAAHGIDVWAWKIVFMWRGERL